MATELNEVETPNLNTEVSTTAKHKLADTWAFWLLCPPKDAVKKKPKALNTEIYKISTVEDFWAIFNNIRSPSELAFLEEKTNIIFSLNGVVPIWEDVANINGGTWTFTTHNFDVQAPRQATPYEVDKVWETTLLSLIGGVMKVC